MEFSECLAWRKVLKSGRIELQVKRQLFENCRIKAKTFECFHLPLCGTEGLIFLGHERYCGWVKAGWPNQKIRSIKMLIFFVGSFWSHVVKAAEIIIMPFCLSLTNSVKYIFKPNENSHSIYFFVHRECYTKLWPIYDGLETWNIYLFFGQTWSVISLCQALFF